MQIRVSPGIVGPVLRGVVVVLISGPMKRSVGSMGLKSSVQSASESFVCHHGSFQSLWPEPQQYATSTAPLPARLLQDQQRVFPSLGRRERRHARRWHRPDRFLLAISGIDPEPAQLIVVMLENRSLDDLCGWHYADATPGHFIPQGSN